jgi:hypothetical protein
MFLVSVTVDVFVTETTLGGACAVCPSALACQQLAGNLVATSLECQGHFE